MRLIDADELTKLFPDYGEGSYTYNRTARMYIDKAPTIELTASFMRQQAEDELIRIRAEADQRGYERGYRFGLETGLNLKRPTGEWKLDDTEQFCYCSNCEDTFYPRPLDPSWDYCPHCGAKMKGAEE